MNKVTTTITMHPPKKRITAQEFADMLHGREYGSEISKGEEELAKLTGLLVVYGYSDDNIELRGVIDEELPAFDGLEFSVGKYGVVKKWEDVDYDDEEACRLHFENEDSGTIDISAGWDMDGYSWVIAADCGDSFIGYFDIMEDGDTFCRGTVLDMTCLN
jgi:hypothetical protein